MIGLGERQSYALYDANKKQRILFSFWRKLLPRIKKIVVCIKLINYE